MNLNKREMWIIRHGHKLSFLPEEWKKTKRYTENASDDPLSEFGFKLASRSAGELIKKSKELRDGNIKVIYCSPFTRCIQTALEIIKVVRVELGHEIKIVCVYDLGESIVVRPTIYFSTAGIMKQTIPVDIRSEGKLPIRSNMDKKMRPKELSKRFKEISGFVIKKNIKNVLSVVGFENESLKMFNAIKYVSDKNESAIIIGHAHTLDLAYNYFNRASKDKAVRTYSFGGEKGVNTMIGFLRDISKPGAKGYKMIYKPNNKFHPLTPS